MARILTYPERVSHHNIEKLRQCVSNGLDKYPGARILTHADGCKRQELLLLLSLFSQKQIVIVMM